jgi:hypothetical protein
LLRRIGVTSFANGGNTDSQGWAGATIEPVKGGVKYRLWLTMDKSHKIHVMRQAMDGNSPAAEFDPAKDIGNISEGVRKQITDLIAKLKEDGQKAFDADLKASRSAPPPKVPTPDKKVSPGVCLRK